MSKPRFEVIKQHILGHIEKGSWLPGDNVPSENQLAEQFSVSRMTARRALTELTGSGVLERIQGAGTFVATQLPTGSLLDIRNIAEEINERGHSHHARVLCLEARKADKQVQHMLTINIGDRYWFSRVLHFENDSPIQIEDRFVNAAMAPEYLHQDFSAITPSAYLTQVTPLSEADHWIEATQLDAELCALLKMQKTQPCLKISRRTYTYKNTIKNKRLEIVNFAYLYHPGNRYRLGGHLNF
jgi:GntR family histidine utilization transcriptional repressor